MDMTNLQSLSIFLTERLTLAAQEIFKAVEVTVTEYHDEISRSRQENELLRSRLLEAGIELYSELQPGVSALPDGLASAAEPWGEEGADIRVKLELSATRDEPAPPSPTPWREGEARVEDALGTPTADSGAGALLHAAPFAQDVKEEPEDAGTDLRTEASSAAANRACGLEDALESYRLTPVHKALRSKMPLSSKEKAARYRERIKNDPAAREAYLAKRKESYQRRKREGKILKPSISQLSRKDQEKVRQRWKEDQRKHRERKRAMQEIWNFTSASVDTVHIELPAKIQPSPTLMKRIVSGDLQNVEHPHIFLLGP